MIEQLENFARENIILSGIIIGIITNVISYLLKTVSLSILKISTRYAKNVNEKNSEKIVESYQSDIEKIKNLKNKDAESILNITHTLYNNTLLLISFIVIYLILDKITNRTLFLGILIGSSWTFIRVFANTFYNMRLIEKSKKYKKYKKKIECKIDFWKSISKKSE
tara:strand:+ start:72 stop:569 length:498 start_codon:yes stop_codon:yes gene_type:complete